jgi:hypothetical protein
MHPSGLKTLAYKNLTEEGPVHPIIGFLEVQFQEDSPKLPGLGFLDVLLEGENALMDVSPFDKSGLGATNGLVRNRG